MCWCPPCERDEDCPEGRICRSGQCVVWSERCEGPLRLWPDHGPTTGGTLIDVAGGEFHIGALEWWVVIGAGTLLHPVGYVEEAGHLPCSLSFLTPPMPAGTYPVHVFYGWPPFEQPLPEESRAGTFTYEPYDEPVGHGFCRSDHQCAPPLESCDLGTGRCVPAVCRGLVCESGPSACDHIEGCLDPGFTCESSDESSEDCRLIRSSCGCHAVYVDDPRTEITSCTLGGCEVCSINHCDTEHIEAICRDGRCSERRGDPQGPACRRLEPEPLPGGFASDGWVRGVRAARSGELAALVWTQPDDSPYYRYGVVRAALVNGDGELQGPIASLAASYGRDSNPSVAADEEGYGVAWVSEMGRADLNFQRLSTDGALVGEPATIAQSDDMTLAPRILPGNGGFDLFWAKDSWSEQDGLYHAELTPEGAVVGPVAHVSWMVPDDGQMDVVRHRDRFAVAWSNKVYDFQGLYWTEFPLSQSPVWLLSEEGAEVAMKDTGLGFTVVWRQSGQGAGGGYSTLHLQSFDQDGESLNDPVQLVGYVEPGESEDTLRFVRFLCVP